MKKIFTLTVSLLISYTVFSQNRLLDLPFDEDFSSNSLATNHWTTFGGTNWRLSATMGDPPPSVIFYGTPVNYDQTLESDFLDATSSGTESIFFTFDMAVSVINATGNEILTIEVNNGTGWQQIGEFNNGGGGMSWSTYFYDITSYVANSSFKIRFRAHGQSFADVNSWMVDNINVYLSPVGVKQNDLSQVKIYPNPVSGSQVTFDLSNEVKQIVIYDILGNQQLCLNTSAKDKTIKANIASLSNGIYLVKFITTTGNNFARRLVVK